MGWMGFCELFREVRERAYWNWRGLVNSSSNGSRICVTGAVFAACKHFTHITHWRGMHVVIVERGVLMDQILSDLSGRD